MGHFLKKKFFIIIFFFFENNNRAQIIVFGRFGGLRRAYKNYQLLLIWLAGWLAGYWVPEAGWSGWVVDVSSTGWN